MNTIKTLAELEAEDAAGFMNPPPTEADKERERLLRVERNAGGAAYARGESRDRNPHQFKGPKRAAWNAGYDNAKSQDAPEGEEPEDDADDDCTID